MLSIEEYVCNLIAGNNKISDLYFAVDRARDIVNKDNRFQRFCKKISFPGIGTKVYTSSQLIYLDDLALCNSLNSILDEISGTPTIDQYILLLLKGKSTIRGLYQACCRANTLRDQAKSFCYTFNNPYPSDLTDVNRRCLAFKSANEFTRFFCNCEKKRFNPELVFNKFYAF